MKLLDSHSIMQCLVETSAKSQYHRALLLPHRENTYTDALMEPLHCHYLVYFPTESLCSHAASTILKSEEDHYSDFKNTIP